MKKPIEIVFPPETQIINTVPESIQEWRKYHLPDAKELIHQWPTGCMWEQWYDNPLSFLHLLHVEIEKDVHLSFSTNYHELYVIHLLHGGPLTLHQPKNHKLNQAIRLQEQEYAMTYLPKDEFEVQLPKGRYVVFYFVIKSSFLLKEPKTEFMPNELKPLKAFRNQMEWMVVSQSIPISTSVRLEIDQFLRRPGDTYQNKNLNMIKLTFYLLNNTRQETAMYVSRQKMQRKLLDQIKTKVQSYIDDGRNIVSQEISENTGFSYKYLNKIFMESEGIFIPQYILHVKMEKAIELLNSGEKVEQVARYVNLSPNYFRKIFQERYGTPPSEFKASEKGD